MIDSVKMIQSQEAKTALGWGTAEATAFYFISGYCMESLLSDEARFNKDFSRCLSHMMQTAKDQSKNADEIIVYKCYENDAMGTPLFKISTNYDGLFFVDMEKQPGQREKIFINKKEAIELAAGTYRETLIEADREQHAAKSA